MPEVSPSVLIIRLDAIGDALALTPLLAALRRRSIATDIVLRPSNAGIFSSRAARHIFTADFALRSNAQSDRAAIEALGAELQNDKYSHVLVATEDPSGYRLARAVGAPVRIGFDDPIGKPFKALWSRTMLTKTVYRSAGLDRRAPHECEVLFSLGASLVGEVAPTHDVAALRPLVLEREPQADDSIAIQITEKWERLGLELFGIIELVRRVGAHGALHLLSDRREAEYAKRIEDATGLRVSLFDQLEPWKAAIAAAPAIVAPDSGALHVAGMLGTPIVAVFPPSRHFDLQVARWSPWAATHRIVRANAGWPERCADALAQLLST